MIRTSRQSWALLVATLWLPVYMLLFVGSVLTIVLSGGTGPEPGGWFAGVFVVHLLTMGLSLALLAVYVLDVLRNVELDPRHGAGPNDRVLWVVLVVLTGFVGQVIYWWLQLRPASEPFRRRRAGERPPPPFPPPPPPPYGGPPPGWTPHP